MGAKKGFEVVFLEITTLATLASGVAETEIELKGAEGTGTRGGSVGFQGEWKQATTTVMRGVGPGTDGTIDATE